MESRTKKFRQYIRRSAQASVLVISSCFCVVQTHAPNYEPNMYEQAYGTLTVAQLSSYGNIRGSTAIVDGGGTATLGGNTLDVITTNGAVIGSYASVGNDGTARAKGNKVYVTDGDHSDMHSGFTYTYGNCTTEFSTST